MEKASDSVTKFQFQIESSKSKSVNLEFYFEDESLNCFKMLNHFMLNMKKIFEWHQHQADIRSQFILLIQFQSGAYMFNFLIEDVRSESS